MPVHSHPLKHLHRWTHHTLITSDCTASLYSKGDAGILIPGELLEEIQQGFFYRCGVYVANCVITAVHICRLYLISWHKIGRNKCSKKKIDNLKLFSSSTWMVRMV